MAKCSICGKPATTQVTVSENGQERLIALCDEHYAEVVGHRGSFGASPLESLFQGGLFERMLGDSWSPFEQFGSVPRRGPTPARRNRSRESVDLRSFLSEAATERRPRRHSTTAKRRSIPSICCSRWSTTTSCTRS